MEATLGRRRARSSSVVSAAAVLRALPELTRTLSTAGDLRWARDSAASARADSPVPDPALDRVLVPAAPPAKMQPAIRTSHRTTMVFGWRAEAPETELTARARRPDG